MNQQLLAGIILLTIAWWPQAFSLYFSVVVIILFWEILKETDVGLDYKLEELPDS